MYSFEPNEEQKMLVEAINRYATSDLRAAAHDADEEGCLKPPLIEKGWELGFLQASIPEAYGGFGERSVLTGVLAAEEMAYGDLAGALAVMTPGNFAFPLLLAGSEAQKQAYLPPLVEAEWKPYSAALIEPHFDFDAQDLRTEAIQSNGGYILQGEKVFVPYAAEAPAMMVYARLDGQTQGFIVPRLTEGMQVEQRQATMGIRGIPLYRVTFDQVHLPVESRLGEGEGHACEPILDAWRVAMAAMGIGVARAAFEYSRDYAKEREAFGVKIAQKQAIAFMLAEMAIEIESMRMLAWEAAWMLDTGKPEASKSAYLAFTGAMDMAMMVTDRAVQILGGHGFIREHPVELWMRNGRGVAAFTGLAMV